MLTTNLIDGTNIIEITINGDVTRADFDAVAAKVEAVIAEHGSVRLLEVIADMGRMELSALWQDLKFAPSHLGRFSHVAVVGHGWEKWATKLADLFLRADVKFFKIADLDDARTWLRAQPIANYDI